MPFWLLLIQFLPYWLMDIEAQVTVVRESNTQRCFPVVCSRLTVCVCLKVVAWHTNDLVTLLNAGTMFKALDLCV